MPIGVQVNSPDVLNRNITQLSELRPHVQINELASSVWLAVDVRRHYTHGIDDSFNAVVSAFADAVSFASLNPLNTADPVVRILQYNGHGLSPAHRHHYAKSGKTEFPTQSYLPRGGHVSSMWDRLKLQSKRLDPQGGEWQFHSFGLLSFDALLRIWVSSLHIDANALDECHTSDMAENNHIVVYSDTCYSGCFPKRLREHYSPQRIAAAAGKTITSALDSSLQLPKSCSLTGAASSASDEKAYGGLYTQCNSDWQHPLTRAALLEEFAQLTPAEQNELIRLARSTNPQVPRPQAYSTHPKIQPLLDNPKSILVNLTEVLGKPAPLPKGGIPTIQLDIFMLANSDLAYAFYVFCLNKKFGTLDFDGEKWGLPCHLDGLKVDTFLKNPATWSVRGVKLKRAEGSPMALFLLLDPADTGIPPTHRICVHVHYTDDRLASFKSINFFHHTARDNANPDWIEEWQANITEARWNAFTRAEKEKLTGIHHPKERVRMAPTKGLNRDSANTPLEKSLVALVKLCETFAKDRRADFKDPTKWNDTGAKLTIDLDTFQELGASEEEAFLESIRDNLERVHGVVCTVDELRADQQKYDRDLAASKAAQAPSSSVPVAAAASSSSAAAATPSSNQLQAHGD